MANQKKTYFLTPGWDFPAGSIVLGSIIEDPRQPESTLYIPEPDSITPTIYASDKYDFSSTLSHSRKGHCGLFARFLQVFGIGGEVSVHCDRTKVDRYAFKHMHTEWFISSAPFIEKAMSPSPSSATSELVNFLKQTNYEEAVYMIIGLKTVEGASITTFRRKDRSFTAALRVNATPVGLPLSAGPEATYDGEESDETTFQSSTPIVVAYRLKEIKFGKKRETKIKDYTAGALFGVSDGQDGTLESQVDGADALEGLNVVSVYDEGEESVDEECLCVEIIANN